MGHIQYLAETFTFYVIVQDKYRKAIGNVMRIYIEQAQFSHFSTVRLHNFYRTYFFLKKLQKKRKMYKMLYYLSVAVHLVFK